MIQRIQTVYLLLAAVCSILLCTITPLSFTSPENASELSIYSMDFLQIRQMTFDEAGDLVAMPDGKTMSVWGLAAVAMVVGLLCLGNIFLYKKRILQARLNVFAVVGSIGYYAMMVLYTWFAVQRLGVDWHLNWTAGLPLVMVVLIMMATRRILADEALVRSADRLR